MKRTAWVLAAVTATLIAGSRPAQAVLVMELDPTAFTIRFLGSDTGTPNSSGIVGRTDWSQPFSLTNSSNSSVAIGTAIS